MRTSILYGDVDRPSRACLPAEVVDAATKERAARYLPSHVSETRSLDLRTLKIGKPRDTKFGPRLHMPGQSFDVKRGKAQPFRLVGAGISTMAGGRPYDARVVPEEYVAKLDELDVRIAVLEAERRGVLQEAMRHGRPLTVADVEPKETKTQGVPVQ